MTTSDGRTHNVRVGDEVHLLDNNQYRILKITSPPGPVVLKRTNHTTYRSFLRTPSQLLISPPRMVNQSTQTDPQPVATDDPLARAIFHCCGPHAVEAYTKGHPYRLGDFHIEQH